MASNPTAVLSYPLVLYVRALAPTAVFAPTLTSFSNASAPRKVSPRLLVSHPSRHVARAHGAAPSQLNAIPMRITLAHPRSARESRILSLDCFCSFICVFICSLVFLGDVLSYAVLLSSLFWKRFY